MHNKALAGDTALTVAVGAGERRVLHHDVHVGIGEHDERIVAAQLEVHTRDVFRTGRHHAAAGGGAAGEADRVDFWCVCNHCADIALAGHDLNHVLGYTRLVHQAHGMNHGERRVLARFDDHSVARHECRTGLVAERVNRKIERQNRGQHPERLAVRHHHVTLEALLRVERNRRAVQAKHTVDVLAEHANATRNLVNRLLERFARLEAKRVCDLEFLRGQEVEVAVQNLAAFPDWRGRPDFLAILRGVQNPFDLFGARDRHGSDHVEIRGVDDVHGAGYGCHVDLQKNLGLQKLFVISDEDSARV